MVRDIAKMFAAAWVVSLGLILGALAFNRDLPEAPGVAAVITALVAGLAIGTGGLVALVSRDRFAVRFGVSREGAVWENASRPAGVADAAATVATIGGILSGHPAVAAAGVAGRRTPRGGVRWSDLCAVVEDPERCVLTLKRRPHRLAFRLYCTPENYGDVLAFVRASMGGRP